MKLKVIGLSGSNENDINNNIKKIVKNLGINPRSI